MISVHIDAAAVVIRDVVVDAASHHIDTAVIGIHMDAAAVITRAVVDDLAVLHINIAVLTVHLDAAAVAELHGSGRRLVARNGHIVQIDLRAFLHMDTAAGVGAVAAVDDTAAQRYLIARIVISVASGTINPYTVFLIGIFGRIALGPAVDLQRCIIADVEYFAVTGARAEITGQNPAVQLQRHGFTLRHDEAAAVPVVQQRDGGIVACRRLVPRLRE